MDYEENAKVGLLKDFFIAGYENITSLIISNLEWLLLNSIVIALQLIYIFFSLPWYLWVVMTFLGIVCVSYPATFALTRYIADLVEYKVPPYLVFFKYFFKFWNKGIKFAIVAVLCISIILANICFYFMLGVKSKLFMLKFSFYLIASVWLWVLGIVSVSHIHLFPMVALRNDFDIWKILKDSVLLTLAFPLRSFLIFFLSCVLSLVWVFSGVGVLFFIVSAPILLMVIFFRRYYCDLQHNNIL